MADMRKVINAQMAALIDGHYGCLDAAAETINARLGHSVNKGTLSKRLAGHIGWPVDEVIALEDSSGAMPVTRMMARRLKADAETARGSMILHASRISKESGEAVTSILEAIQSDRSGDWAKALTEAQEAKEAIEQVIRLLEVQK